MNIKTASAALIAALAATVALSAPKVRRAADGDEVTQGRGAKIIIAQEPRLGLAACLSAPSVNGA